MNLNLNATPVRLYIKVVSSLVLGTTCISGVAYSGSMIWTQVTKQESFEARAYIGPVSLQGNDRVQAKQSLQRAVELWKKQGSLMLKLNGKEHPVNPDLFSFDIDGSVQKASLNSKSKLLVDVNEEALKDFLQKNFDVKPDRVDWQRLKGTLLDKVSNLSNKSTVNLQPFYKSEASTASQNVVASSLVMLPYDVPELEKFESLLDGLEINPKSSFSLTQVLIDSKVDMPSSETINILATAIYSAVLRSNFEIEERHIGRTLPVYADLGYEAYVIPGEMDLSFKNTNATPYTLHFEYKSKQLKVFIMGSPFPDSYQVGVEEIKEYPPRTIVHFSHERHDDLIKVVSVGSYGHSAKVFRIISEGEQVVDKQLISDDFYFPAYRILEQAVTDKEHTEDGGTKNPSSSKSPSSQNQQSNNQSNKNSNNLDSNQTNNPVNSDTQSVPEKNTKEVPEHVIGKKI